MDLVFTRATVLTGDDAGTVLPACDIVVGDGSIVDLGPGAGVDRPGRVIDAGDLLVMPGLVNGHTHSPETLAKGRAERATLDAWLAATWPWLDALEPRQIEVAALLGAAEMLHTGTIGVVDHFRQTPMRLEAVEAVSRAYRQSGMRAVVAVMVRDAATPYGRKSPPVAEQIAILEEAHARCASPTGAVRIALGPSAPTRCSDAFISALGELSARRGLLVHTHVDETRADAEAARAQFGTTSVAHLAAIDLLSPSWSLAHGVWLDNGDIDLLAEAGAAVIHNPVSNMRLGSGIAPVAALRQRGVPVALGTDGAASNDGQNMLEALKMGVLLQRVAGVDPEQWLSAREALAMATSAPARIFGFGTGRLEPGAPADFIAIRRSGYAFTPCNDWHRQIVLGAAGLDVRHAVIAGELVLDDGRITTFDEAAILAEAMESGAGIFAQTRKADG
jgi:guanine deaminase